MMSDFTQRHRSSILLIVFLSISLLFLGLRLTPFIQGIKYSIWYFLSPKIVYSGRFFNKLDDLSGRFFRLVRVE
ncbi:MAG: hypothetical protein ACKVQC_00295, partial [Elusimicrobiota bacterium]